MPATGGAPCPTCDDQAEHCPRCGGRAFAPLIGPARLRGVHWAESVVRRLAQRWPVAWPHSSKALIIAGRHVSDLVRDLNDARVWLARECLAGAAQRYEELTDFLRGRRLRLREPARSDQSPGDPEHPE